jgi:nicotinamide-nucleotide amidase
VEAVVDQPLGDVVGRHAVLAALLGVPNEVLERSGSVSAETVRAMAEGARRAFEVDVAVAESGIASPLDPPRPERPGGLYFVGLAAEGLARVERYIFTGGREATKRHAAAAALRLVLEYLDGLDAAGG